MSRVEHRPQAIAVAVERRPAGVDATGAIPTDWVERFGVPPIDDADEQRAWLLDVIAKEERRLGGPVVVEHEDAAPEQRSASLASAVGGDRSSGSSRGAMSVAGVAVPFGGLSSDLGGWKERFARGAFSEQTPRFEKVFSTLLHDRDVVLGTTRTGTLQLRIGPGALEMRLELPESSYVRSLVARGDLHGASIGFSAKRERWAEEGGEPIRTVEAARLIEVALVHLPAYPDALVSVESSLGPKPIKRATPHLDAGRARHAQRRYPGWRRKQLEG